MSTFQKKYLRNTEELAAVPVSKRAHYYFDRSLLRTREGFTRQDEPLLRQEELHSSDLLCKPFWDDERDGAELDSEGRAFAAYRQRHPDFDLRIREQTAKKLLEAQQLLPAHLRIVLKAGLRPVEVQQAVFDMELANVKKTHPQWSHDKAYRFTLEFVTDPAVNLPPHASGGTVDVHLWDTRTNAYADLGSPINAVDDSSWGDNVAALSPRQVELRFLLRNTMLAAGFANLASEWWHFSYGDQRWAVFYDQPAALYGAAEV